MKMNLYVILINIQAFYQTTDNIKTHKLSKQTEPSAEKGLYKIH